MNMDFNDIEPDDLALCNDEDDLDTGYWTTANGDRMRITDMGDRHLLNTIAFLQRQATDASRSSSAIYGYPFHSEDAEYEAERQAETLTQFAWRLMEKRKELLAEAARRGLET